MATQAQKIDALEEEMSRFEQEVLGTASSRPPPLMSVAPSPCPPVPLLPTSQPQSQVVGRPTEGGPLLQTPNPGPALLQTPGQVSQPTAPRPPLQPPGSQTSDSRPLLPQLGSSDASSRAPRPLLQPNQPPAPGFVPRQALTRPPSSVGAPVRAPTPLMGVETGGGPVPGGPGASGSQTVPPPGPPVVPPIGQNPLGQAGPLAVQPTRQNGPPSMPPPDPVQNRPPGLNGPQGFSGPPRMPPPGHRPGFPPPPPPGMTGPPGQHPVFPPGSFTTHHHQPPGSMLSARPEQRGAAVPPPPQLQTFTPPTQVHATPTPLNPMAIAQAVAGATTASGMSASGPGFGASLLPVPHFPPKKGPKQRTDPKKLRMGGGKVWEDHSLDDWDPNDFRIFVGDLGNDVNDDTLTRSFSRFSSFLKAKVIRDKYTKKTKGYGFVSFRDPKDFMQAMREMNGKYIGNRPIKLRKSTWKDRQLLVVKKKEKEKKRLGFK